MNKVKRKGKTKENRRKKNEEKGVGLEGYKE